MHDVDKARGLRGRQRRKRADSPYQPLNSHRVLIWQQAHPTRQAGCGDHSPSNSLAVKIFAIRRGCFEGMGERMAEIQDFAQAGFAFIAANDSSLSLNAAR